MFYFAIPPTVFADTARSIKHAALSTTGWNRMIVEKPFGRWDIPHRWLILSLRLTYRPSEHRLHPSLMPVVTLISDCRDSESSAVLAKQLSQHFAEEQVCPA